MSESSEEEVLQVSEKFKYLFQGSCFKFGGLTGEIEEEFVKLVKEMGAEVSNHAEITFVQRSYFEKKENSSRDHLYNIDYIADSVKEGSALDLKDYMFIPDHDDQLSHDEPLCYAARYMYKTDSCQECYYTKVFCKECAKESIQESLRAAKKDSNHIVSATDSSSESEDEIMNSPDQEVIEHVNKSSKRLISSKSEQDSNDEEQFKSSSTEKSPVRKKLKNSSDIDDTCYREKAPEIDVKNYSKSSGWISFSKPQLPVKTKPPALPGPKPVPDSLLNIVNGDDEEGRYFKGEKWWLQQSVPENEKCTIVSCSFEPTDHPRHYPPSKFLSLIEKKILVKYLIIRNSVQNAKGKTIYENMIKNGYLTHRTWETLNNCFRRTILKEIEDYKLDKVILDQFLILRIKNVTKVRLKKT